MKYPRTNVLKTASNEVTNLGKKAITKVKNIYKRDKSMIQNAKIAVAPMNDKGIISR